MGPEPELPAYQALLALEKGTTGSPIEQLTEAAKITGVDFEDYNLDLFAGDGKLPSITPAYSAPKEEWVLRWLLKKLKGPTDIPNEYRNNSRSWILLRILFMRIPIRSLAFTLSENDFLGLLRDSLVGLDFSSGHASPYDQVEYNSKAGSPLKRKPDSDSSKQIRKRTRTDGPIAKTKPEEESSHYDTFLAIIESVNTIIKLTEQIPQSKDVLKAQLKLVLRGGSETSAIIIGKACSYAQSTINHMKDVAATSFPRRLHTSLVSVLEIWTLRSDHHENGSTASSNEIFVSHALVGVLGLIRIARQFSNNLELVNGLERLVALHVVLGIREVFFSSAAADTKNESGSKSSQRLSHEFDTKLSPILAGAEAIILPTLFDISIRSMPRNNFRRQVHETPWLESFLILLLSQAGYPLEEDRKMRDVTLLQEFLDVAIRRKLKLSLVTLVQVASKFSGLSGTQDGIEWSLIARILRLDVDVFLLNSGVEQSVALLNSLLAGITAFPLQNDLASEDLHDLIKHEIIIPLARGFFNARDGPAFIELWAEQIAESESSRHFMKKQDTNSIWESDDVVKACGQCLASSDTQLDAQVGDLLKKIHLIKLSADSLSGAYSSLVVLDSLLMSPIKSGLDAISIGRYEQILEELSDIFSSDLTENLASLTSDTRQLLFTNILVSLENEPTSAANIKLSQIWKDFLCFQSGMELTAIVDDLVTVAYVPRSQRGLIIDTLQSFLLNGEVGLEMKVDILLLATRLVEVARSSAQIFDNPDKIWEISRSIIIDGGCDNQLLFDTFTKLYEAITVRFEAAPQDSVTKFLSTVYSRTTERLPTRSYKTMEYPLFILCLSHLHKRERQLGEKRFQTICTLRHKVFDDLISDLHTLTKSMKKTYEGTDTASLIGVLCLLDNFQDLRRESKDSRKKIRKLEEFLSKHNLPMSVRKQSKLLSLASKAPSADFESRLHDCMALFPIEQLHGRDQRSLVHKIRSYISEMEENTVVKMIHNICEAGLSGEENSYRLLLLGVSVIRMSPVQDRDSTASNELSTAFTKVSAALAHNGSIESFCLAAEALDIILRTQSRSVTQWNIDNLLANICLIVSPSGPPIDAKFAGTIHTRLCKLLGTLFTLYRQKLSGRFHLVLPVMQALLRCLFTYNLKSTNSTGAVLARPPWVEDSHSIEPRHGTQFSRLLSSLCDPTVSSVQRPGGVGHSKQALNDNTKKVKSLAGQYLQYLVMEYTSCQLKGHILPEMKAALMPGMYVILDVMSQSTMRAMNAGMDSSSRAVFKTLYDDYIRFGKWDHN
ncbi:hypothetical protein TEQG_08312 [Trichophyton equinum CBS 127.97]|uniref:Nucleolar 27S pre-rRNA processing Urb2/Npa2 C-terminal domain-containing protein n=1 Tax=Trichophyton equinum (strain ATCC MYA-4606 / CBS 127.97) TaxID=559882 RepID=F2Q5J3_TRIEC|nr:hypothetical protein TEQG_08312 [Trichophyton equinum CBS 127.97]